MKKKFKIEELCCANCAAKIEAGIKKIPGVTDASISIMTEKLTIETEGDSMDEIIAEAQKIASKIEPDCRIIVK